MSELKEAHIKNARITSTTCRPLKNGGLATIITLECKIPATEVTDVLDILTANVGVGVTIRSFQAQMPLSDEKPGKTTP